MRFIHAAPEELTWTENVPIAEIMVKLKITVNRNFIFEIDGAKSRLALAQFAFGLFALRNVKADG